MKLTKIDMKGLLATTEHLSFQFLFNAENIENIGKNDVILFLIKDLIRVICI